jgi:hypothetical protein
MKNRQILSTVLRYEIIGFVGVLVVFWINEIIDLPHLLFHVPPTPINLAEAAIESVVFVICGAFISLRINKLLKRIKYLEGFLRICAFCKKINVDEEWIPLEVFVERHSDAVFSHGLCPKCLKEHYGEYLDHQETSK